MKSEPLSALPMLSPHGQHYMRYFGRVTDCYGSEPIDFLELGLSADSSYGAAIPELYTIPFLTNSDAHSPYPDKLGREFNRIRLNHRSVKGVLTAIKEGAIAMNAGFFPEEGKYNRTACTRCFTQYSLNEANRCNWRCPADGGIIKKGVSDRAKGFRMAARHGPDPLYPCHPSCPDHTDNGKCIIPQHKKMQGDLLIVYQHIRERNCRHDRYTRY